MLEAKFRMARDPYEVLGVPHGASEDTIKAAYRRLAKAYHPDLHPGDAAAAQKMNEINQAYEQLKNPAAYAASQAQQAQSAYRTYTYTSYGYRPQDQADPFEAFFRDFAGQRQYRSGGPRPVRPFQILRTLVLIYLLFNLVSCMASSLISRSYRDYDYSYGYSQEAEGPWSRADQPGGWGREAG